MSGSVVDKDGVSHHHRTAQEGLMSEIVMLQLRHCR
jgi:hypothetical protein